MHSDCPTPFVKTSSKEILFASPMYRTATIARFNKTPKIYSKENLHCSILKEQHIPQMCLLEYSNFIESIKNSTTLI